VANWSGRPDEEGSSSHGQRLACPRFGFAARHEAGRLVASSQKGLFLEAPHRQSIAWGEAAVSDEFDSGM
jgi:hypothetical protein